MIVCPGLPLSFARLSISPVTQSARDASTRSKKKGRHPYEVAQAEKRKAANLARRQVLEQERASKIGDPVLGNPTPFTESLVSYHKQGSSGQAIEAQEGEQGQKQVEDRVNFFLSAKDIEWSLMRSKELTTLVHTKDNAETFDPEKAKAEAARHEQEHANAAEAIRRIVELSNASGKDRTRVNIQRCIDEFGRHKTDKVLAPKPKSAAALAGETPAKTPRGGPDTGSSEVQVAILTAKIQVLAKQLETTSHKDKHNKRNLRLLVHRRQKLLKYLRRKERGGPRWQNLVEKLGLTEASWQGEISM